MICLKLLVLIYLTNLLQNICTEELNNITDKSISAVPYKVIITFSVAFEQVPLTYLLVQGNTNNCCNILFIRESCSTFFTLTKNISDIFVKRPANLKSLGITTILRSCIYIIQPNKNTKHKYIYVIQYHKSLPKKTVTNIEVISTK